MTVCVAAMCDNSTLIGASDRMLTAGDVQFEPQQTKIIDLTTSIAVMIAGDTGLQVEILHKVRADVYARIEKDPKDWWNVADVADLYSLYYKQAKLKRAENSILAPLGLDNKTYLSMQQQLSSQLVAQLATELINFEISGVQTIFAGVDITGAHIYVSDNGRISCHDSAGFAAIGAGYWHADSQLMFAGHTKAKHLAETLLLTYSAKKRAEIAPGVGVATDMFMIGPGLGSYVVVGNHVLGKLEEIYQRTQKSLKRSDEKARRSVNQYVQEILDDTSTAKQQTATKDSPGNEAANKENNGSGAQEDQREG